MKILFFQPDFTRYASAYYQRDFYEALAAVAEVFAYGPGYPNYRRKHTMDDILSLCPFEPELICFGSGWEYDRHQELFDPHPALATAHLSVPRVMVLNKEYKKLDLKFEFMAKHRIAKVFTTHHNHDAWSKTTGIPFVKLPFAADPELFRDYGLGKMVDFGFTGALHTRWISIREEIKAHIARAQRNPDSPYHQIKLMWGEGDQAHLVGEPYAKLLNVSRIWLSTPSAIGLVGPRFYEVLASQSLLFCPDDGHYEGLFEDGQHCVMFKADLSDFDEKLFYYLNHENERLALVNRAHDHFLAHHTWAKRAALFLDEVRPLTASA